MLKTFLTDTEAEAMFARLSELQSLRRVKADAAMDSLERWSKIRFTRRRHHIAEDDSQVPIIQAFLKAHRTTHPDAAVADRAASLIRVLYQSAGLESR